MGYQIVQALEGSVSRVITRVVTLLPGIVAFIVVGILFFGIAAGLAWCTQRLLAAVRFDSRFEQNEHLVEWTQSPSRFVSRVVFWVIFLFGLLEAIAAFEAASTDLGISAYVFAYMPRLLTGLVLLFFGTLVARVLSRSVVITCVNMNFEYARPAGLAVRWMVLVLTAAMALDHLHIGGAIVDLAFGILFGGIVLTAALSVGLGSREWVSRSLARGVTPRASAVPVPEERIHHF